MIVAHIKTINPAIKKYATNINIIAIKSNLIVVTFPPMKFIYYYLPTMKTINYKYKYSISL